MSEILIYQQNYLKKVKRELLSQKSKAEIDFENSIKALEKKR